MNGPTVISNRSIAVGGCRHQATTARRSAGGALHLRRCRRRPVRLQDLALGMSVNIDGTVDDNTGRGRAKSLSLVQSNTGAITSIDRSSQTITVMGLIIKTNTATAYKNVASFSALAVRTPLRSTAHFNQTTPCWRP